MASTRSIWQQLTAILLMIVFAGFTFLQDAHYLLEDHHTEQEECTDRSTHHYHQDYADEHCSLCLISHQSYQKAEIVSTTSLSSPEQAKWPSYEEVLTNRSYYLSYSLRAPPL